VATATKDAPKAATTRKRPSAKAPASSAQKATEQPKKQDAPKQTASAKDRAEWIAQLKKLPGDQPNEKYPDMTNAAVVAVASYQLAREGKGNSALTPEEGVLLRSAARAHKAFVNGLMDAEKKALGEITLDELTSDEERERHGQKPGLKGLARFQWVVHGLSGRQQAAAARTAAKATETKEKAKRAPAAPKDPSGQRMRRLHEKDGRWAESAFEKLAPKSEGILVFALTDRAKGTMQMVGHLPGGQKFYDVIHDRLKELKLDTDEIDLVTISARYGYTNRPEKQDERYRPPMVGLA
jgi:hypothetical protein